MHERSDNAETGGRKPPVPGEGPDAEPSEAAELEIGALEAELPPMPERIEIDRREDGPPTTTERGDQS